MKEGSFARIFLSEGLTQIIEPSILWLTNIGVTRYNGQCGVTSCNLSRRLLPDLDDHKVTASCPCAHKCGLGPGK